MRQRLGQVAVALKHRFWLVASVGIALSVAAAVAAIWIFGTYSNPTGPAEGPPQAPASASEPTLVSGASAPPTPLETHQPSPFAGIAAPPPVPPPRPGRTHHGVRAGALLWALP